MKPLPEDIRLYHWPSRDFLIEFHRACSGHGCVVCGWSGRVVRGLCSNESALPTTPETSNTEGE